MSAEKLLANISKWCIEKFEALRTWTMAWAHERVRMLPFNLRSDRRRDAILVNFRPSDI